MSAKKLNKNLLQLLIYVSIIFLLILTSANINNYLTPKNVLGAEVESNEEEFWNEFLAKNPNYIPGWIELGRYDKVMQIDPNYFREP